ncbi:MAG TPA: enoyl-ACP reductase FabI [Acidimicrobiales bacterium]|nr:enoyl-ACP reductase FabI [Acidimicrobiales bacterium]
MGLLEGKRILVTGVLTDDSLAFGVADRAQREGAEVVLTGHDRALSLTRRVARKLPNPPEVLELDVTHPEHLDRVRDELGQRWGGLDGILHAIAFAPPECLGGDVLRADWEQVAVAMEVSAYSLKALTAGLLPLMEAAGGGSVVGLDFDATVAWPAYAWMGVAKAALESLARYLARDLGSRQVRVNLVAAGPVRTMAAKSIPGFGDFEEAWNVRAPLGWDVRDPQGAVARACVALLSDLFPMTTGEIVHVDGGYHAVGA